LNPFLFVKIQLIGLKLFTILKVITVDKKKKKTELLELLETQNSAIKKILQKTEKKSKIGSRKPGERSNNVS